MANRVMDILQGASNAAASTVSGPVDARSWILRKGGVPVGDEPFGGSEWMTRRGLTRAPQSYGAGLVGEALGGIVPIAAAAKAPQIAAALLQGGRNLAAPRTLNSQLGGVIVGRQQGATAAELATAQQNAALPVSQGGLGLHADNTAADRMRAMNMEAGWYRGGAAPVNGLPTGPWYTQIPDEAAEYARRTPAGVRDVREYALSNAGRLKFDGGYPSRMADDLAELLDQDGHAAAATMIRNYYADGSPISGMAAYKFLQRNVGEHAPAEYLNRLGFRSVEGVNSPNYRQTLTTAGTVRDAKRAAFDPMRRAEKSIFASAAAAVPAMALLYENDQPGN